MLRLLLGSRGSPLALWQAHHVAGRLRAGTEGLVVEIAIIKTEGDQKSDMPLTASAGKGVFVREIEEALLHGSIDLAVHSLKDLPTDTPQGLAIAAVPKRHDPRDALVSGFTYRVTDLKPNAVVGTGSPRRQCQLLHARPDLKFTAMRGNIDTRVRKLEEGQCDALVLAVSGIARLGLKTVPHTPIPVSICLPAPGQGALAIETRADDSATRRLVEQLNDSDTAACVLAERSFLAALGAGCLAPAGALATLDGDTLVLEAMIGDPEGRSIQRDRIEGEPARAEALGRALAQRLFDAGGGRILDAIREAQPPGPIVTVRVLVTRPPGSWPALAARYAGTSVLLQFTPTTIQVDPIDPQPADAALRHFNRCDWLVVTSPRGVEALARRLAGTSVGGIPGPSRFAAVGPATARALEARGWAPEIVAAESGSDGLAAALLPHLAPGARVVLVRPEGEDSTLAAALRAASAEVVEAPLYRTIASEAAVPLAASAIAGEFVCVVFTAPSSLLLWLDAAGDRREDLSAALAHLRRVAIGSTTAHGLARAGLPADEVANDPTELGVGDALARALARSTC